METEVGVEGNGEAIESSYSSLSSIKQFTDPVVYKLVRLEGDGRLVPATDDEFMEVEGLLNNEKSEMHIVADSGQAIGCISNEGSSSGMLIQLESLQGLSDSEKIKVAPDQLNARLEYIEEMLQKVKEEERLRLACGSPDYSSAYVIVETQCSDRHDKLPGIDEKLQSEIPLQGTFPLLAPTLSESYVHQSGSIGECSNPPEKLTEGGSLIATTDITAKPDFSKLKGEICLDHLSIRELHETFKATFGRETTVKDKQWLKRRITMGLTNSCDVSATTFIIKDNKLIKTAKEEDCKKVSAAVADDLEIRIASGSQEGVPVSHDSQLVDCQVVSDKNCNFGDNSGSEDHHTEQRAAKRVRKPTRRYIEELSEVESKESSWRLRTLGKNFGPGQIPSYSHVRPIRNVASDGRTIMTRLDSLGGSGIEIPCVSRVRRSRPRKNFMALLKFNPSGVGMTATFVKKALGEHTLLSDDESGKNIMKTQSAPEQVHDQFIGVRGKETQFSGMGMVGPGHHKVVTHVNSSGDSDDNVVTVPTSKGGIRRKHHRAWTLSEVMKLVEGVSRYGAGRWSEIKRLAFASYSYRTSVDLKDKWRNLLKASFAQIPSDKGINSRKNAATMPIPEPILLRVRELAEMQSQVMPNLSSSKVAASTGNSVHEKQAGYL